MSTAFIKGFQNSLNIENRAFRFAYLTRIRKDKARKLFDAGETIYILPKKLNPFSEENMLKEINSALGTDFDNLIKFERADSFNNKFGSLYFYIIDMNKTKPRYFDEIFI